MSEESGEPHNVASAYRWAAREGRKVGPNALAVLVALLSFANLNPDRAHFGSCFPSQTRLAQEIYGVAEEDVTRSQLNLVSRAVGDLASAGLITREQMHNKGKRTINFYTVNLDAVA